MENLQLLLEQTALTNDEYDLIVRKIGRDPNVLELGLFGALWSCLLYTSDAADE